MLLPAGGRPCPTAPSLTRRGCVVFPPEEDAGHAAGTAAGPSPGGEAGQSRPGWAWLALLTGDG